MKLRATILRMVNCDCSETLVDEVLWTVCHNQRKVLRKQLRHSGRLLYN